MATDSATRPLAHRLSRKKPAGRIDAKSATPRRLKTKVLSFRLMDQNGWFWA
jgi:hypothetical protein